MKKQKGFTLIEIMISLLLGLIVIGGALSIYISTVKGGADTGKSARLNYDLEAVMQFMVNDIRRAGYWGNAVTGSNANLNPFTNSTTSANIQVIPASSCILYTYDADADGTPNNGEFYGFKLDSGTVKTSSANTVDDTGNCSKTDSRWIDILDSDKVEVTALTFSEANSQCLNATTSIIYPSACSVAVTAGNITTGQIAVEIRQIDIILSGRVKNDTAVIKTLSGTVKVRNNRIFTQ